MSDDQDRDSGLGSTSNSGDYVVRIRICIPEVDPQQVRIAGFQRMKVTIARLKLEQCYLTMNISVSRNEYGINSLLAFNFKLAMRNMCLISTETKMFAV
jgi:hypothetical protein